LALEYIFRVESDSVAVSEGCVEAVWESTAPAITLANRRYDVRIRQRSQLERELIDFLVENT
jgi:hypothetical protein